jgi:hypothetical protein
MIPEFVQFHLAPASARMFYAVLLRLHDNCVARVRYLPLGNANTADCGKYFGAVALRSAS